MLVGQGEELPDGPGADLAHGLEQPLHDGVEHLVRLQVQRRARQSRVAPVEEAGAEHPQPADGPVQECPDDRIGRRVAGQRDQVALDDGGGVIVAHGGLGRVVSTATGLDPNRRPVHPPRSIDMPGDSHMPMAGRVTGGGAAMKGTDRIFDAAARADRAGIAVTRIGLVVVLVWIGGLKAFRYEDEGIVPYVANSPVMSFFYLRPAGEYRGHMNREGELIPANRAWHEPQRHLPFAHGLGSVIVALGVMIALHPRLPRVAALGSFLVVGMSLTTLSFLVTTPECWVPSLGSPEHGFPLLAGPGRLVIKDAIMLGAAVVTMADSAKAYLRGRDVARRAEIAGPGPILSHDRQLI